MRFLAKREVKIADEDIFISKVAIQKHFGFSSYLVGKLVKERTLSEPVELAQKVTGWPLTEVKQLNQISTS
ncbi:MULTISPECIES: hypothetical protein [unclassified Pseudoalteromonas]|uniref:hypothetical protein n=1 Tax=unclassified Pseudoalteromonas TaxID=194690 RepID=UPI0006D68DB0|nr:MULTISPECIES: hypothetical protein [unclassified Pseudoalteromonas]KPZ54451.1 hypothetical protein AN393_02315 [Pseudoalteromonas sp. P1-25]MCK8118498.1 hypothetical protein [Pseudoalteromonas sp. 2CM37A]MDC9530538.1 hypothetical protein [Pseudoalteromonas sp. Angola-7]